MRFNGLAMLLMAGAAGIATPLRAQETGPPSGPLSDLGQTMAAHGLTWRSLLTDEYAANPKGGVRQAENNVGQVYLGADLDLDKAVGLPGGSFHVVLYRDYGSGLAHNNTGTLVKQQENYKNEFTQLHLGLVAYEQKLFSDKLDIIAGRLGSTAYFGKLTPNCFFMGGATCGVPTLMNSEAGFTFLPSATWGVNVKYKTSAHMYVDAGVFEVNPFVAHTDGFYFSTAHSTGVTYLAEIGYENNDLKKVVYPSEWKVGFYHSTPDRKDIFYNTHGQSFALFGGTPRPTDAPRQGFWIMGDRTVWRPDPTRPENITLFGGWIQPLEHQEIMDRQVYGGLLWRGPIRSRPADTIGLVTTWFHLSDPEVAFLRDSRIKAGGSGTNASNEFVTELNYGYQVNRSIRITPNIQYIANPDNSVFPKIDFVPKNILVIGVKLTVNLAGLLGLPSRGVVD